jgi:hypothetical protein
LEKFSGVGDVLSLVFGREVSFNMSGDFPNSFHKLNSKQKTIALQNSVFTLSLLAVGQITNIANSNIGKAGLDMTSKIIFGKNNFLLNAIGVKMEMDYHKKENTESAYGY